MSQKINVFIDGSNIFLRNFFALRKGFVFNSKGQDNSTVQVFLNQLTSLFSKIYSSGSELGKFILVIDRSGSIKHREVLSDYKNKKPSSAINKISLEEKENGFRQMDVIKKLVSSFPSSAILEIEHAEGDLVLSYALLENFLKEKNIVMTGDKDYIQLLKYYPQVILFFATNKFKDFITPTNFRTKLNLEEFKTPYEYFFAKIIVGDSSDNIKGIEGMGWKRAAQFIEILREDKNKPEVLTVEYIGEKLKKSFKFLEKKDLNEIIGILQRNTQLINLSNFSLLSFSNKQAIDAIIKDLIENPKKGNFDSFKRILNEENIEIKFETELFLRKIFKVSQF